MSLTPDDVKEEQFRAIYEFLSENPRIFIKKIAKLLKIKRDTASNRLKEALEQGWFSNPQIRRRSYANFREYTYLLRCENSAEVFSRFIDNENITYHALTGGPANLWVVSRKELDFECNTVLGGPRSDYHISFAPNQPWGTSMQNMREMVEVFNPKDYEPEGILKTHWNETIEWDSEYEKLFQEFNYDLRKAITPILRKHLISWGKLDKWLKNLSTSCTVFTLYYPGTISSYDPYLFMFETDYDDFLINLFSELPTSTWFFKVSNRLFSLAYIRREYMRVADFQININKLQIPNMITKLIKKGVIKTETHGIVECYWNSDP